MDGQSRSRCNISIPREEIAAFCESNHILRLSLFGSVLRDDFHAGSDVDVLVEFEPEARVTYLDKARIRRELTDVVGRRVDLRTPAELSRYFRQSILNGAEVQFDAMGDGRLAVKTAARKNTKSASADSTSSGSRRRPTLCRS